jgi:pilus assembly protein FimV
MELTAGEPGMFRKSAIVLALLLLSLSYRLYALGLGEIEMHSALNQPMSADISLISATGVDLSGVKISLASRAAHEYLGLSRVKILSDFSFAITEDSRGTPIIHISSTELVQEPYLEFLLEMHWQSGQMVREYTVLVDPPVTMQARPAVPVAPVARTPQPAPVIAEPIRQIRPAPAPGSVRPAYVPAPVKKQAVQHYGPVRRDDTLWSLAKNLRPSADIGIEQMMIALQRANPDAFADNNINNLHAGVTLKVPDRDAILALTRGQARAEARRQYREWHDKRNAAKTVAKQPVAEMPVREEEMPVQQDEAVVETEAQLKLTPPEGEMVAGSASGSEAGDTDSEASGDGHIRQQLVLASEEVEAGRAESEELQSRVQELEDQVQNMQRLLELKSEELAGMQNEPGNQVAEAVVSEEMPAGEEQQSAEEADVEAEFAAGEDSPVTEPRSIVDRLMDNPVLAGLGVLIAMLLGGFLWGSMRKHRSQGLFDDEMTLDKHLTKAGGDEASSAGLSISDPGKFDEGSPDEMESHASDDVNDPVTEADVYLAYGRIQQAEDVLQAALQDDPENVAIRSKLLRVYHAAGNATAFNSAAGEFRELIADDDGQWQRIAVLGNELSPGNELYRSETETPVEQDNVVEFEMDSSEPGDASSQAGEIAEADAAVQELDMAMAMGTETVDDAVQELDMGTETVDDAVQELEMATETVETEILPESIEFTLDDEDEYENEAEGLLASADEVATKLDLARAYLDMEDPDGARSILQEVIDEGDEEQKSEAQSLISKIA